MKCVALHGTSLKLSRVCLGGGRFGAKLKEERAFEIMDAFAAAGGLNRILDN